MALFALGMQLSFLSQDKLESNPKSDRSFNRI